MMGRIPEGQLIEGGYKSPSVNHLWPHHYSMARMVACGAQPKDIALATGFSEGQISRIMGSPLFQEEVGRLAEDCDRDVVVEVRAEIHRMCQKAIMNLDEDLHIEPVTDSKRKIRQAASFGILEKGGYVKPEKPMSPRELHLHQHLHEAPEKMSTEDLAKDVLDIAQKSEDD